MIPCICVDDTNRPDEIPESHWIKSGTLYHITDIRTIVKQGNILGVELNEINLVELNVVYRYFKLPRFAFTLDGLIALQKLISESRELCQLDDLTRDNDIMELIKRQTVEIEEHELIES